MSSANVELVRGIVSAWERGDFSSAGWADSEIQFVIADGPSPGTWVGRAGMADGWRDWLRAWSDVRIEVEGCDALDGERVAVLVHSSGHGKESGLEIGERWRKGLALFHVREGTVRRLVIHLDRDGALADLGRAPEPGSG
jgi:hypothetical protein